MHRIYDMLLKTVRLGCVPGFNGRNHQAFVMAVERLVISCDYSVMLMHGHMIRVNKMPFSNRQRFL